MLVVDDNPDNLEVIAMMLGRRFEVVTSGSPVEALTAVERVDPALLVLDIGMAPIDGIACLNTIRAIPRYAATPAIALTAFARQVEREAFLAAGFQAVVTKPILDPEQLEDVVHALLAANAHGLDPTLSVTA